MRRIAKIVKDDAKYVGERSKFHGDMRSESQLTDAKGAIMELKARPKVGKKLVKVGTALVLAPEPFGAIPGSILIASGLAMSRYRDPISLADIEPNLRKMLKDFESGTV